MKILKMIGVIGMCLTASACFLRDGGDPNCISTHEKGCLSPAEFRQQAAKLAEDYRSQPNFSSQWGLATIRADQAYGNLALLEGGDVQPGAGQTIGVIDSGIDTSHPLFEGKDVTEEFMPGVSDETGSEVSHGTAVASVIAGNRLPGSPSLPHGVAWGADLAVFAMTGPEPPTYQPISLAELKSHDAANAAVFKHVLAWEKDGRSLDFVNFSVGYDGIIDGFTADGLRANYGQAVAALAQEGSADKTVTVWSAGNAHGEICTVASAHCVNGRIVAASPELLPGLPLHIEELRGHHIAVVALGRDGTIAHWSNRCGAAADWCIAAPGEEVAVAYFGPDSLRPDPRLVATADGTSFSAPMVTGGLAVMKHFFRNQLTNTDLVARLFATADRTGKYADKAVYGQGLLDLGAATTPVGTSRVALGSTVGGRSASLPGTALASGGALGDGLALSLAGTELAAFDALGAPFWFDLGNFVPASDGSAAAARFERFVASARATQDPGASRIGSLRVGLGRPGFRNSRPEGLRPGPLQAPAGVDRGHLGLAEHALAFGLDGPDGLAAAAFSTEGMDGLSPASGAVLSWRGSGMPAAGLRVGWLAEREELLGTSAAGAFGGLSAESIFAAIEGRGEISGWELYGSAEIGTVAASPNGGLIADVSTLTTSAFTLNATRALGGGTGLGISVSQPLRVESGQAALSVPAGRTKDGRVLRRRVTADLSPSGQQIDVMAGWHWRSQSTGNLRLAGVWSHHPGHRAGSDPELALLAGWRYAF